jgi:DNA primase
LFQRRALLAWTGRALGTPVSAPRYLSSKRIKETIFNEDALMQGGRLLFITEGVFDAMKLDYHGLEQGVRATCGFGISWSMEQIVLMNSRRNRFDKTVVLFDRDAVEPAFIAKDWLPSSTVTVGQLPDGVKDPAELSKEQIQGIINGHSS